MTRHCSIECYVQCRTVYMCNLIYCKSLLTKTELQKFLQTEGYVHLPVTWDVTWLRQRFFPYLIKVSTQSSCPFWQAIFSAVRPSTLAWVISALPPSNSICIHLGWFCLAAKWRGVVPALWGSTGKKRTHFIKMFGLGLWKRLTNTSAERFQVCVK